jgi:hypothetical protein
MSNSPVLTGTPCFGPPINKGRWLPLPYTTPYADAPRKPLDLRLTCAASAMPPQAFGRSGTRSTSEAPRTFWVKRRSASPRNTTSWHSRASPAVRSPTSSTQHESDFENHAVNLGAIRCAAGRGSGLGGLAQCDLDRPRGALRAARAKIS